MEWQLHLQQRPGRWMRQESHAAAGGGVPGKRLFQSELGESRPTGRLGPESLHIRSVQVSQDPLPPP
ncbi:hypothetical protein ABBQ32_009107 [Trebouxia sp. C0010 RCD-2024]